MERAELLRKGYTVDNLSLFEFKGKMLVLPLKFQIFTLLSTILYFGPLVAPNFKLGTQVYLFIAPVGLFFFFLLLLYSSIIGHRLQTFVHDCTT